MSGNTLLITFLFLQVFIMGVLAALALRSGYAHFKGAKNEPEPAKQPLPQDYLTPVAKEHLAKEAQADFQAALKQSANKLDQELKVSTGHINNLVMRLASEIVAGEMERYRTQLGQLHDQASAEMSGISKEVAQHQEELKTKIGQELEAEKQRLIKQIDAKLADAVASFLVEALRHNVDLGSQGPYLISLLEEHKSEFVEEVGGEPKAAK